MQTETINSTELRIAVNQDDRQHAIDLLEKLNLPTSDIHEDTLLYILRSGDTVIGTGGLEIFEDCALLRSVSVAEEAQGKGFGKIICGTIESYAKESGITCLYLLTASTQDFFDKNGYCTIKRENAPEAIKQTAEFSSLCPVSAVVMKKRI